MSVTNYSEMRNSEKLLMIDDSKTRMLKDAIPGIKIELYKHQKVLLQQIIDYIENGKIAYNSRVQIANKNIWIKSDIGTGKTLIFLSLCQYYKNHGYTGIPHRVPLKADILTPMLYSNSKRLFKPQPLAADSLSKPYYTQVYSQNAVQHEILMQSGFIIEANNKPGQQNIEQSQHQQRLRDEVQHFSKYIEYKQVKPQSIVFCQNQVIMQFVEYIEQQTSLTYYLINNNVDFIKYLIEYDKVCQDVILWNTDTIDILNAFTQVEENIRKIDTNIDILSEIDKFRRFYNIDSSYGFNAFWIDHICKRQRAAFVFCVFDDFDLMQMPQFQPIPSLYNIFIGSTMIDHNYQNTNCCSAFIFNQFINSLSSFRVQPQQLQEILRLPKVEVHNIICNSPSYIYSQFKVLEYFLGMYNTYLTIVDEVLNVKEDSKKHKEILMPQQDDYQQLVYGNINMQELCKKYLYVVDGILNPNLNYSLRIIMQVIQQIRALIKSNICEKDPDLKCYLSQLAQIIGESQDNIWFNRIKRLPKDKVQTVLDKMTQRIANFGWNIKEMDELNIRDVIKDADGNVADNKKKIVDPVLALCCGTLFNKEDINSAVTKYSDTVCCCAFCKQQIQNIQRNYIYDEEYLAVDHKAFAMQQSIKPTESMIYTGQTKLQSLYEILNKIPTNQKTILFVQDQIKLEQKYITPQQILDIKFDTTDVTKGAQQLADGIMKIKPLVIERYQHNQDYYVFQQEQEKQLTLVIQMLQRFYPTQFQLISETYKLLKQKWVEKIPRCIIVNSLKQIIGENMIYVDNFIFFNIPQSKDEYLQIIGRSNRIGRKNENNVYMFYYPKQPKLI